MMQLTHGWQALTDTTQKAIHQHRELQIASMHICKICSCKPSLMIIGNDNIA